MNEAKNEVCCISGKADQPKAQSWEPCCARCRGVWNICCTSVEDGKARISTADNQTLEQAFIFEQCRSNSRKSLRVALAREISKRMRAEKWKKP